MSRTIAFTVIGIIVGIVLGYALFAQAGDGYVSVKTLLTAGQNQNPDSLSGALNALADSIEQALLDLKTIRRNIAITALVGGLLGALASTFLVKRSGR